MVRQSCQAVIELDDTGGTQMSVNLRGEKTIHQSGSHTTRYFPMKPVTQPTDVIYVGMAHQKKMIRPHTKLSPQVEVITIHNIIKKRDIYIILHRK